ncbi:MAG: N-6 DNA methylase, partial [Anaerolineae bacterium CFX3]|nr:N-6 DNA methylase [Anaerolineae bacterium CFX3]
VPDGVLFGSSRAHVDLRRKLIEENRLDGVVSMPSGVFKPYAGVSTAVLLFTKGAQTKDIWFYDMAHDGFSLDDKRVKVDENDIPDVIECWEKRADKKFKASREQRAAELRAELTPLKEKRLKLQAEVNRLQFESVLNTKDTKVTKENQKEARQESFETFVPVVFDALNDAQAELVNLESEISPLQSELDRLTRQFWVTAEQVRANKYDLSASRYRHAEADAAYHEAPAVTLERLARLEGVMLEEIRELGKLVNGE